MTGSLLQVLEVALEPVELDLRRPGLQVDLRLLGHAPERLHRVLRRLDLAFRGLRVDVDGGFGGDPVELLEVAGELMQVVLGVRRVAADPEEDVPDALGH